MDRYRFFVELDRDVNKGSDKRLSKSAVFYLLPKPRKHRFRKHATMLVCDRLPILDSNGVIKQFEPGCFRNGENCIEEDMSLKLVRIEQ